VRQGLDEPIFAAGRRLWAVVGAVDGDVAQRAGGEQIGQLAVSGPPGLFGVGAGNRESFRFLDILALLQAQLPGILEKCSLVTSATGRVLAAASSPGHSFGGGPRDVVDREPPAIATTVGVIPAKAMTSRWRWDWSP